MNYKTYAEAKIANPDCEIVTTSKDWGGDAGLIGVFEALVLDGTDDEGGAHEISDTSWVICNPADYCSTLKEFLGAGLRLVKGDKFLGVHENVIKGKAVVDTNTPREGDEFRYILSAAALNGGCKIEFIEHKSESWTIDELLGKYAVCGTNECELFFDALESAGATWPDGKKPREDSVDAECVSLDAVDRNIGACRKRYYEENGYQLFTSKSADVESESWTIYNNTMPLSELSDEQAAQLFNAWRAGGSVECDSSCDKWLCADDCLWISDRVYRIKPKSERELFIGASIKLVTPENYESMDKIFGAQFDAGARYKDLTQFFGENI